MTILFCFAVFGLSLAWLTLSVSKFSADSWRKKICLNTLSCAVYTQKGARQPGDVVYFDSVRVAVAAILTLPQSERTFPFALILELLKPNGKLLRSYSIPFTSPPSGPIQVNFDIDPQELFNNHGNWTARLHLEGIGVFPKLVTLTVPRRHLPETDLEREATELVSIRSAKRQSASIVFTDSEHVEFRALFRATTLPPCKFENVYATLRLSCAKVNMVFCSNPVLLAHEKGRYIVAYCCKSLLETEGEWIIRLFIHERMVYEGAATVISPVNAARSIEVSRFDIFGVDNSGQHCLIGNVLFSSEIHTLRPRLHLHTAYPTSQVMLKLECKVHVDNVPLASYTSNIAIATEEEEVQMEDVLIPRLANGSPSQRCSIALFLDGRCLARREINIKTTPPKFARIQTRLIQAGITLEADSE
jgi:hypothetical protein